MATSSVELCDSNDSQGFGQGVCEGEEVEEKGALLDHNITLHMKE
jgi:hypothetical protein